MWILQIRNRALRSHPSYKRVGGKRSLYVAEDMKAGDIFTQENLRCVRPGLGLASRYYELLLGKKVNRDVKKGEAVEWEMVG